MGRRLTVLALPLVLLTFSSACSKKEPPQAAGEQSPCPAALPGTSVAAESTSDGAAMSFTTRGGDVTELRRRVHDMAQHMVHTHRDMHGGMMRGDMRGGMQGAMMDGGMHGGMGHMSAATVTAEDVEGGARLRFTPRDPSTVDALRAEVSQRAQNMADHHDCPAMSE